MALSHTPQIRSSPHSAVLSRLYHTVCSLGCLCAGAATLSFRVCSSAQPQREASIRSSPVHSHPPLNQIEVFECDEYSASQSHWWSGNAEGAAEEYMWLRKKQIHSLLLFNSA